MWCHDVWTYGNLNCLKLLDIDRHPNARLDCPKGNIGSDFSELESVQSLSWALEIAFLKYFEDSEIYGIPDYDSNITW
jgi:hypothetical protein